MYENNELIIRPTQPADVPTILELEADIDNRRFIIPWPEEKHRQGLIDPLLAHLTILDRDSAQMIGFIILGLADRDERKIEFIRIVIGPKRMGYGRLALRAVQELTEHEHDCQKLWLDVFEDNQRAKALYTSEGFQYMRTISWASDDGAERQLEIYEKNLGTTKN